MGRIQRYGSTISIKTGECSECANDKEVPLIAGLCQYHYKIKSSLKSAAKMKERQENLDEPIRQIIIPKGDAELNRWFADRRLEMTGFCKNCGGRSCRDDDKYFKFSIAHILPKAYFPSVRTHTDNWLELCFWGKSCHTNMDNKTLDLIEMNCWDEIVIKVQKMYPDIDLEERRRIPDVLRNYIEIDI